jgi:formaldehyde-activating enzyme involved in methanogenesis
LTSKLVATVSPDLASKPVAAISPGLTLKSMARDSQFEPQNRQLWFGDWDLKITVTVS